MEIYNFDAYTGAFIGASRADKSPLDGEWLIPAFSTDAPPPDVSDGEVAVFRDGEWAVFPDTLGQEYWTPDGARHVVSRYGAVLPADALYEAPDLRPVDVIVRGALDLVDQRHAQFIRELTGNATIEERDTWKLKEEAARAYLSGGARDGQKAMIELEAAGTEEDPADLAARIVAKADSFQTLVGIAAGLRGKARAAIARAAGGSVSAEQARAALDVVVVQIEGDVRDAIVQWQAGS